MTKYIDRLRSKDYRQGASRLDDRCREGRKAAGEESPGSTEKRCRITSGGGDPRESATENKPPGATSARVKRCGKSAPRAWQQERQGKPHREQNRIGAARRLALPGPFRPAARVGCMKHPATDVPDEWSSSVPAQSERGRGQNPAYRPAGTSFRREMNRTGNHLLTVSGALSADH